MIEYPKFSEFAKDDAALDGEKIKLKDILNQEILILGHSIHKSKFKDENYLTIQFEKDTKRYIIFTGSCVLMDQIEKYADKIPFITTIRDFVLNKPCKHQSYLKQQYHKYIMAPSKKYAFTKEILIDLHINQKKTPNEIAEMYGCSRSLVTHYLKKYEIGKLPKFKRLEGKRFNRLLVVKYLGIDKNKCALWRCKCDCGSETVLTSGVLIGGHIKSCGCLTKELTTKHRMVQTRPYSIWRGMKTRCNNPNAINYENYGGRGISYDPRWEQFELFWEDMKDSYFDGSTIERIDNDKGYCKSNCKWATVQEQNYHKRNSIILTFNGFRKTITEWSNEFKITPRRIYYLHERGLSEDEILSKLILGKQNG